MAPLLQWRYNKCQNWIQQKTNDLFLRLERDSTLDEIVVLEEAGGEEEEEDEEEGEGEEGEAEDATDEMHQRRRQSRLMQLQQLHLIKHHHGYPTLSKLYQQAALHEQELYRTTLVERQRLSNMVGSDQQQQQQYQSHHSHQSHQLHQQHRFARRKNKYHLQRWLKYERLSALFVVPSVVQHGEEGTQELWGIDWNVELNKLLQANRVAQQVQQQQSQQQQVQVQQPPPPPGHTASNKGDTGSSSSSSSSSSSNSVADVLHRALSERNALLQQGQRPPNITIVSLCQYDPGRTPLGMLSIHNKLEYSNRHGYDLYVETSSNGTSRHPAWGKLQIMKKYLSPPYNYDWVVWTDCDTFFMNQHLPIDVLLTPSITSHQQLYSSSSATSSIDLIVSEDGNMLNTGFFMMRSTAWSVAFLEDAYDSRYNVFVDHPWWEQSSMFYLMVNMCPHEYTSKIVHVHQNIVNPYPKEYSNPIHQHYQEVQMFYDGGGVVVLWCCFLLFTFCFLLLFFVVFCRMFHSCWRFQVALHIYRTKHAMHCMLNTHKKLWRRGNNRFVE